MTENPKLIQMLEIAEAVLRSWWLIALGVSVGIVGSALALRYLPKTYKAETMIFVAPSRVPLEFLHGQGADDLGMRVASLRESVLSRPYLLKVAAEVYGQDGPAAERSHLIQSIAGRLEASVLRIDEQRGSGVFSLSYKDGDPERSARAVNMLADLFIDENVRTRTTQAGTTTKVLDSLAEQLKREIDTRDHAIAQFKAQHMYELPDHLQANLQLLEGKNRDLQANGNLLIQEQNRRELLIAQRSAARATAAIVPPSSVPTTTLTPAAQLVRLRAELDSLLTRYTNSHPLVRAKQREIADLEAHMPKEEPTTAGPAQQQLPSNADPLDTQIAASDRTIQKLQEDREALKTEIEILKRRVENTPQIDQQLSALTKGYDVLADRFKNYQTNLENARGSEKVEQARQGEQFQVIEKAVPPLVPVNPSPRVILPFGVGAGLALCVGPLVVFMVVNPRVRSRQGLKALTEVPVLVTIGSIDALKDKSKAWRQRVVSAAATVACVVLLVAAAILMPR